MRAGSSLRRGTLASFFDPDVILLLIDVIPHLEFRISVVVLILHGFYTFRPSSKRRKILFFCSVVENRHVDNFLFLSNIVETLCSVSVSQ